MIRRSRWRKLWTIMGVVAVSLVVSATVVAQSPYPSTPPEFPVLDAPHDPLLSPLGGKMNRPMLVLYVEFEDETFDRSNPPPFDDRWANTNHMDAHDVYERFFGAHPSVAGYFEDVSGGNLILTPAEISGEVNEGDPVAGVVTITIDENKGGEDGWVFGPNSPPMSEQQETLLKKASENGVNFEDFDTNGDGRVTEEDLIIVRHDVDPQEIPGGSGAIRPAPAGLTIDGVTLGMPGAGFRVANSGTATNLMTIVHEIGHQAFDMPDTYHWQVGKLDLAGPTSNSQDREFYHPSAWLKMHLGWTTPTVVMQSGFYEIPRGLNDEAFILYDPERGTDDYFIVEYRERRPDALSSVDGRLRFTEFINYDQGASATGLVVWRIDESQYHPVGGGEGFISLLRSPDGTPPPPPPPDSGNYGGGPSDAWSPPPGASDDERTMDDVPWEDGTPSNIAIRAITAENDVIRAYFDVRGPGLLIEPITDTFGNIFVPDVLPGESTVPFSMPVMNTGEATDTFAFFFDDLPAGWTSEPHEIELAAGETASARSELTAALDAVVGHHELTLVGEGDGVREEVALTVNIRLEPSSISYTGDTYVPMGETAGFEAVVTMQSDGSPVTGVEVTFDLSGPGGERSTSGTTGHSGVANADLIIDLEPGDYTLSFGMERFGKHAPASGTTTLRVPTVAERLGDLINDISGADLNQGVENSLISQLSNALEHVDAERETPACNTLNAFGNHVDAQSGGHIPDELADQFQYDLAGIMDQFGCAR